MAEAEAEEEEEEDWDVEGAARKRDVQVMFTVPKARLRVVNADMDRASMRSASEGAGREWEIVVEGEVGRGSSGGVGGREQG
ncbi:hypothetical protein LTR35_014406 [Friedmanniomyces endolithicus]|nr:hypothetical protein LTR35_014406 [Friedmanniomyces endolithicus]